MVMDRNELEIHVVGTTGSGKSTIQALILDYLRVMGFDIEMGANSDFQTEEEMREVLGPINDRIGHIREMNNKIIINEVQAKREIHGRENAQVS